MGRGGRQGSWEVGSMRSVSKRRKYPSYIPSNGQKVYKRKDGGAGKGRGLVIEARYSGGLGVDCPRVPILGVTSWLRCESMPRRPRVGDICIKLGKTCFRILEELGVPSPSQEK